MRPTSTRDQGSPDRTAERRLVLIACSNLGLPLKGAALYVLNHLAAPNLFWKIYRSLSTGISA